MKKTSNITEMFRTMRYLKDNGLLDLVKVKVILRNDTDDDDPIYYVDNCCIGYPVTEGDAPDGYIAYNFVPTEETLRGIKPDRIYPFLARHINNILTPKATRR